MTEDIQEELTHEAILEKLDKPDPPRGYRFEDTLFADLTIRFERERYKVYVWANFIALIPLSAGILLLWLPYQFYIAFGLPYSLNPTLTWSIPVQLVAGLIIIVGSMFLHEYIHGIALSLLGYKPTYHFNWFFLLAGVERGTFLPRRHYLIMGLTPLISMTVLGGLSLIFLPLAAGQIVLIALLLNMPASIGDILVANRVRQWGADTLFTSGQSILVYVPEEGYV